VRLESSFEVPAAPETAWEVLLDPHRVIPCLPGAQLDEIVDEKTWKVTMRVRLGPMSLTFATDVTQEEADEAARRTRLVARAREARGRGAAHATMESTLTPTEAGTKVDVATDVTLTGAVAQFGRPGIVQEVSSQIVSRFAECLQKQLTATAAPSQSSPPAEERPVEEVHARPLSAVGVTAGAFVGSLRRFVDRLRRR
jgi:carbon monoxide dehydrogenase subunit G